MKYCKSCGLLMADEATVCPSCGAAVVPEGTDTSTTPESGPIPTFAAEAPAAPEPPIEPSAASAPQPGPAPAAPASQGPVYSRGYENGGAAYAAPGNGYAQNNSYASNSAPNNSYYNAPGSFNGNRVPQEQTLTTGGYLFALIIFMIPLIGLIMELVWSFGGSENLARQSLARAYLIRSAIIAGLTTLFCIVIGILIAAVAGSGYYY